MDAKLEIDSLTRVVDGDTIVDSISMRIAEGTVVAVIGPSGAGKSSFLRLLNRLDEPTAGTVSLDGVDYRDLDPQELRCRVGLVPQDPALQSGTVAENVALGARVQDEPVDHDQVDHLLCRVGLEGYADRDVTDLSGGERQRVSFARTLYIDPDVILLDEPTAHLDAETEQKIERLLVDTIREDGLTCVLVTHDRDQATRLADRIVTLVDGQVESIADQREVVG
jgi:putative ABC transport system ATP-binding protein